MCIFLFFCFTCGLLLSDKRTELFYEKTAKIVNFSLFGVPLLRNAENMDIVLSCQLLKQKTVHILARVWISNGSRLFLGDRLISDLTWETPANQPNNETSPSGTW